MSSAEIRRLRKEHFYPLVRAIQIIGGREALLDALKISRQAYDMWEAVPPWHCPTIERLTGGEIKAWMLRPDCFAHTAPPGAYVFVTAPEPPAGGAT